MVHSAAPSHSLQLSMHQAISLNNVHGWTHTCSHLHLTTSLFIILCEGCVGGVHISIVLTLPSKCYFTFMWCIKSFGWVFRNTFIIMAIINVSRCCCQSRCPSMAKHPEIHHRVQPWGFLKGSWSSDSRLKATRILSQGSPWQFCQRQGSAMAVLLPLLLPSEWWNLQGSMSISCPHAYVGQMYSGGQYFIPSISFTNTDSWNVVAAQFHVSF